MNRSSPFAPRKCALVPMLCVGMLFSTLRVAGHNSGISHKVDAAHGHEE